MQYMYMYIQVDKVARRHGIRRPIRLKSRLYGPEDVSAVKRSLDMFGSLGIPYSGAISPEISKKIGRIYDRYLLFRFLE